MNLCAAPFVVGDYVVYKPDPRYRGVVSRIYLTCVQVDGQNGVRFLAYPYELRKANR